MVIVTGVAVSRLSIFAGGSAPTHAHVIQRIWQKSF
ncbi:hypothetical protein vBSenH9_68 [Salmonella phage vB_Sen_H9]|nr:hypothetical protein vBSenH9_68 [Salmonella phage vB_Sen_H9]